MWKLTGFDNIYEVNSLNYLQLIFCRLFRLLRKIKLLNEKWREVQI